MVLQAVFVTLLFTCAASTLHFQRLTSSQPVCCYGVTGRAGCSPCDMLSALDKAPTPVVWCAGRG